MGERLPCKQEVKGSNPSVSIGDMPICTLKTAYTKILQLYLMYNAKDKEDIKQRKLKDRKE